MPFDPSDLDLTTDNVALVESLYEAWIEDPTSVDSSWHPVFEALKESTNGAPSSTPGPSFEPRSIFSPPGSNGVVAADAPVELDSDRISERINDLIGYYRLYGHLLANLDPLGRQRDAEAPQLAVEGLLESDVKNRRVRCDHLFKESTATIEQVVSRLRNTYAGNIGVEYMHIPQSERRRWLQKRMEWSENSTSRDAEAKRRILRKLTHGHALEQFLHTKYVGMKRFSIQGGESLVPALDGLIEKAGDGGIREIVIGMAHRGRLVVLSSVLRKSADEIFSEFEKNPNPRELMGSGDVKYHMGFSHDHVTEKGNKVHLSLAFNPSHLEAVNPVVLGRVRAKEDRYGDHEETPRGLGLLLHGDAAFAGQGLVAETLQLSQIEGYTVGGSIHVVINNQIGFTTNPSESRSTTYATDIAHMLEVPIFHVNGDDVEAVVHVMELALDYRQHFHTDVVIDLVCYRRYGHNEGDEPRFTQPEMYRLIDDQESVRERYAAQLVKEGVIEQEESQAIIDDFMTDFSGSLDRTRAEPKLVEPSHLAGLWSDYRGGDFETEDVDTVVDEETLKWLSERLTAVPDSLEVHRIVQRLYRERTAMGRGERPIDWGMGEALAFASLLTEGTRVRVSGQDSIRGTFGHRHAAVVDAKTGERYMPLAHLSEEQASFQCFNSMLSEAAVLGFDYGYSLDSPDVLVIWEAQFGDFANNAQVVIDQFITSGEAKWKRLSGLVMLLPHGYMGQGPEHSSARLERFLQLCAADNIQVCNLTTPAQYFHALRRQIKRRVRKPLVVMSPKSLLRHKEAISQISDFVEGSFHPVLPEVRDLDEDKVERVLLCSGKVYYDLLAAARDKESGERAAIIRVEELYPLDRQALKSTVDRYSQCKELVWVQEEPKNMGAWHYILPELIELFGREPMPRFIGRAASASPATGSPESHHLEQKMMLDEAFDFSSE